MKIYDIPQIEIIKMQGKDIITFSANSGDNVGSFPEGGVWDEE